MAKNVSFFTIFEDYVHAQNVHANNFNNLVSIEDWLDSEYIYWLGSPIVEDRIVNKEYYFDRIVASLKKINERNKITYFPHRREKKDKLQEIRARFGFHIKITNLPIELYVIQNKVRPKMVISFYSTALYTLNRILTDTNIYYVSIEKSKLLNKTQGVEKVYNILSSEIKEINTA